MKKKRCTAGECNQPVYAKGLCILHYNKQYSKLYCERQLRMLNKERAVAVTCYTRSSSLTASVSWKHEIQDIDEDIEGVKKRMRAKEAKKQAKQKPPD